MTDAELCISLGVQERQGVAAKIDDMPVEDLTRLAAMTDPGYQYQANVAREVLAVRAQMVPMPSQPKKKITTESPPNEMSNRKLLGLRSGHDRYSPMGLSELRTMVPAVARDVVDGCDLDADGKASALRWVLRGLSPESAVRKIHLHARATAAIRGSRYRSSDESPDEAQAWLEAAKDGERC